MLRVNAHHIKAVPGRKTDIKDCEWIADLLAHRLLQESFIPTEPNRDLRYLTAYRRSLTDERAREVNQLQKVLETANIKLASVVSDVLGVSGRVMSEAILGGTTDLEVLAKVQLRKNLPQLKKALHGRFRLDYRFLLEQILAHLDFLEEAIAVAQTILVMVYHILKDKTPYQDLGMHYCERLNRAHIQSHLLKCLEGLGFKVSLAPPPNSG